MSSGSGNITGFYVEARLIGGCALFGGAPQVGQTFVTESWKRIMFSGTHPELGIKNNIYHAGANQEGVLTYAAASGLMAWVASHHQNVEFRLVKVVYEYSYKVERRGVSGPIGFGYGAASEIEFGPEDTETSV